MSRFRGMFTLAVIIAGLFRVDGWMPHPISSQRKEFVSLSSTVEATPTASSATKETLLATASRLKSEYGVFLIDKTAKADLRQAVEALETEGGTVDTSAAPSIVGDWTLVCTTATNNDGLDTVKIRNFFSAAKPIQDIRDSVVAAFNKYLIVQQRIRCLETPGVIDRVDHTLEYQPPDQLRDILDNIPERLMNLNINPLSVSKSKLVLIHSAKVAEDSTELKIQLGLKSIVLNVAGENEKFLDPNGKDIAGLNLPLAQFLSDANDFTTTYVDDEIRISRGKQGPFIDQLRVFVRSETPVELVEEPAAVDEAVDEDSIVEIEPAVVDAEVQPDYFVAKDMEDATDDTTTDDEDDSPTDDASSASP